MGGNPKRRGKGVKVVPRKVNRPDGYYSATVYLGRDDTGKRKYKTFYGKRQKDADDQASAYRAAMHGGMDPVSYTHLVSSALSSIQSS